MFGHRRIVLKAIVAIALVFCCWVENTISIVSAINNSGLCGIRFINLFAISIGIYRSFVKHSRKQWFTHANFTSPSTNDGRNSDEESGISDQLSLTTGEQKLRWSEKVRVRVVRNLNKYTMQEESDCWYSKNEYQEMDRERQHQRAIHGSPEREFPTSLYSNMI